MRSLFGDIFLLLTLSACWPVEHINDADAYQTLDSYLAPEQSADAHVIDAYADVEMADAVNNDVGDAGVIADIADDDVQAVDAVRADTSLDVAVADDAGQADSSVDAGRCAQHLAALQGLSGTALIEALGQRMVQSHPINYDDAKDELYGKNGGLGIDAVEEDGVSYIYCIYTGKLIRTTSTSSYNTEHSWPQSDFNEREPMRGDINHLFATDATANNRRSNYRFGVVSSDNVNSWDWPTSCNCSSADPHECCSSLGDSAVADVSKVFEVRNDAKGDIARALFYFAVRYHNEQINLSRPTATGPFPNNKIPIFEESQLRQWHVFDPVSDKERQRNDDVQTVQGNRNAFIDCPELVELINDF